MWRNFFQIAGIILVLPLSGCGPAVKVSSDTLSPISVVSIQGNASVSPASSTNLLSAGEVGSLHTSPAVLSPVKTPPFVRNEPKLVPPFPLVLNRVVQDYIEKYLAQPQTLRQSFERSSPYMPEMLSLLENDGLPPEFIYLAFAESAFCAGGAGPWQLNRTTARRYGLTINQWVDERRDPIKSTRAAAAYLAELHDQTGADWRMTVVAWNNGDGGVYRYMQLMTAPYERLMRRLPRRTRSLMNRFMAVALIARHPKEYGLDWSGWTRAPRYHVIVVDGGTQLRTIAESNHTTVSMLRLFNPALLGDSTPPGPQSYPIRVPEKSDANLVATES